MIIFEKIRIQNFLSYGNSPTEIILNGPDVTLLSGRNGSGKSTLLDAICYALFDQPFRDINKPTIPNTINGKNCLIEIEFSIGTKKYLVRRGMKPTIFDIIENGVKIEQDAAKKDYQSILENQILQLNFKSFTQLVILGAASYTPFMKLSTPVRREIVEDLLDITVFSGMRKILKDKNDAAIKERRELESKIELSTVRAKSISKYIEAIQQDRSNISEQNTALIDELKVTIADNAKECVVLDDKKAELYLGTSNMPIIKERQQLLEEHRKLYAFQIREEEKHVNFFRANTSCPTCTQEIGETLREDKQSATAKKISTFQAAIEKADAKVAEYAEKHNEIITILQEIRVIDTRLGVLNTSSTQAQWKIDSLEEEIEKSNKSISIEKESVELKELAKKIIALHEEKDVLNDLLYNYEVSANLLKDSGIKSSIVKEYVPILNKLINFYLEKLDFFVNFTLDENFNETIKARHRDTMKYANFSEGQKSRINIAILFAFRHISEAKNTCNTNLLILDELFSSSMDVDGTDAIVSLIGDMKDRNVFIISHTLTDVPEEWYHLHVELEGNFSVVKPIADY